MVVVVFDDVLVAVWLIDWLIGWLVPVPRRATSSISLSASDSGLSVPTLLNDDDSKLDQKERDFIQTFGYLHERLLQRTYPNSSPHLAFAARTNRSAPDLSSFVRSVGRSAVVIHRSNRDVVRRTRLLVCVSRPQRPHPAPRTHVHLGALHLLLVAHPGRLSCSYHLPSIFAMLLSLLIRLIYTT